MIVFALQLMGSAPHKHDAAEVIPDCVSCHIASLCVGDVPATPAAVLVILLVVAYLLTLRPSFSSVVVFRYFIPPRQAPPRH